MSLVDAPQLDRYVVITSTSAASGEKTLETVETRELIDDGRALIQARRLHTGN